MYLFFKGNHVAYFYHMYNSVRFQEDHQYLQSSHRYIPLHVILRDPATCKQRKTRCISAGLNGTLRYRRHCSFARNKLERVICVIAYSRSFANYDPNGNNEAVNRRKPLSYACLRQRTLLLRAIGTPQDLLKVAVTGNGLSHSQKTCTLTRTTSPTVFCCLRRSTIAYIGQNDDSFPITLTLIKVIIKFIFFFVFST